MVSQGNRVQPGPSRQQTKVSESIHLYETKYFTYINTYMHNYTRTHTDMTWRQNLSPIYIE